MRKRGTGRRGQAAAAAALLAIIAGLIILYILFLPQEDRADILGMDKEGNGVIKGMRRASGGDNETLLEANPGRIDFLSQKTIEHAIPTTHIFTRTAGNALEQRDSLYVKRSVFTSADTTMDFAIEDLANTDNTLLSFNNLGGRGRLIITLNKEEIFNKGLVGTNVNPISLDSRLLKTDNELHFRVSSPGGMFWRTNEYNLENVQVTGDITRTDAQQSKSTFILSTTEFNNLDTAELKFQADCDVDGTGPLDVWVNQYNIYSAIPDCGVGRVRLEFPISYLNREKNEVRFEIGDGDYFLSHVAVETELKQVDFPTYFFELSEEEYKGIQNGTNDIVVRLDFVDSIDRKQGQLIVNGHSTGFDTSKANYELDISRDIERGNNAIKIRPEKTLDVRKLEVVLTEE